MDTPEQIQQQHIYSSTLGIFFSRFITEQAGEGRDSVLGRTAAWLATVQAAGDVCLDLAANAGGLWPDQNGTTPTLTAWCEQLLNTPCVVRPGEIAPMVLDGHRLYLQRFWCYENDVAAALIARMQNMPLSVDRALLQQGLHRLFPKLNDQINWQMLAAAIAVMRSFSVISGGPGTGKTTSLVKVLTLLLEQQPDMHIRMAAPTGKAAARMMESIRSAKAHIDTDEHIRQKIPEQAATMHRLLGYSSRGFRHDKHNPLLVDCLVIDEASMIDLPMMARLLDALPLSARLILLGDRDQLASVDAGNVLGDMTGHGHEIAYSPATAALLAELTAFDVNRLPVDERQPMIADAIALLRTSYRFNADSGIGRLARCVNSGDGYGAVAILSQPVSDELVWLPDMTPDQLFDQIADFYTLYLQCGNVAAAMSQFEVQRVLCAVRHGPAGVEGVNQAIATRLAARGMISGAYGGHGMPVMITANHYELGLFNGDIGLLWRNERGEIRAYFRQTDQSQLRDIPVQSLPQHEPAWAMTVHKSQGSEFDRVILMLPDQRDGGHSIVNRELLYTAITRARRQFILHAQADTIRRAAAQTVNRSTGLSSRLGWPATDRR